MLRELGRLFGGSSGRKDGVVGSTVGPDIHDKTEDVKEGALKIGVGIHLKVHVPLAM